MIIIIEHGWISTWSSQGIGPLVKMTIITMICFVIYILRWYEQFLPVHCSAGIGRSGTLCLVDSCLVMAEAGVQLSLALVCLIVKSFVMFGDESWHHENRHIIIFWEQQIIVVVEGSSYLISQVLETLLDMRSQRMGLIQVWSYKAKSCQHRILPRRTYSCQRLFPISLSWYILVNIAGCLISYVHSCQHLMCLIQTEDQLRFSVDALILALKRLQGEVRNWGCPFYCESCERIWIRCYKGGEYCLSFSSFVLWFCICGCVEQSWHSDNS